MRSAASAWRRGCTEGEERGDEDAHYPFPASITRRTRCTPYTLPPSCYRCCLILVFFSSLILQQSR